MLAASDADHGSAANDGAAAGAALQAPPVQGEVPAEAVVVV